MKVRFVAIFAVILRGIGIVISCFDYAKATPSSNGTEMQATQESKTTEETTSSEGKEGDSESKKTPLIVWLHGSGKVGVGEETFFNSGLLKTLNKWRRQGFNAYVICPHLSENYNTGRWNKESTRDNLKALLDKFIEEHNIDVDRIIVVGHSLGEQCALYMAYELPEYFSRCVVLSGYNPGIDITKIKIPIIGGVGTESAGEDTGSISYMKQYFMEVFGDENTFFF